MGAVSNSDLRGDCKEEARAGAWAKVFGWSVGIRIFDSILYEMIALAADLTNILPFTLLTVTCPLLLRFLLILLLLSPLGRFCPLGRRRLCSSP